LLRNPARRVPESKETAGALHLQFPGFG